MLNTIYQPIKYPSTDKGIGTNNGHCYIEQIYSKLFDINENYKNVSKVLEIGVWGGDSLKLWKDYFTNAIIYGVDILNIEQIKSIDRLIFIHGNAYSQEILNQLPNDFDLIIDDGPHSLQSMIYVVQNYINKLNNNGYLVIEDVQNISWFDKIEESISDKTNLEIKKYDLRSINNRYDDLVFVVKKLNNYS